ncbi:MAG: CZB domain-containing protein [Spirochaetales bacterium]|nr:CZB domain-containing protein [Spirochaetales bacterium]
MNNDQKLPVLILNAVLLTGAASLVNTIILAGNGTVLLPELFLELLQLFLVAVLARYFRLAIGKYDRVILGRLRTDKLSDMKRINKPELLADHMQACHVSRQQTRTIMDENRQNNLIFAREMKDTVHLVTSVNGSVKAIIEEIDNFNTNLLSSSRAVDDISKALEKFSGQVENQTSSVIQTSAAIVQMDASINSVRLITEKKNATARELEKLTEKSRNQMDGMNRLIEEVSSHVDSIQDINSVIDNIAAQTNLLSMNAAIEAAHAGDRGRGFAVVAGEIRKLAESTSENATLISSTLKSILDKVSEVKAAGQDVMISFEGIGRESEDIVQGFRQIRDAAAELNSGSGEIVSATTVLNEVTDHISSVSREISANSREINKATGNIVNSSHESFTAIKKIEEASQDINMAFMTLSQSIINYESVMEKIQHFQNWEFGEGTGKSSFMKIILEHLLWVLKVRGVMDGKIATAGMELTSHHHCSLGKWIDSRPDREKKSGPLFETLMSEHEKLHKTVNTIISESGRMGIEEIEHLYGNLLVSSTGVIDILLKLGEEKN